MQYEPKRDKELSAAQRNIKQQRDSNWLTTEQERGRRWKEARSLYGAASAQAAAIQQESVSAWQSEVNARIAAGLYRAIDLAELKERRTRLIAVLNKLEADIASLGG
jgi:hypothetical protein